MTEFTKFIGCQKPKLLNRVIPNLTSNLSKASDSFIDAVINKDLDFIESTATLALKQKLTT